MAKIAVIHHSGILGGAGVSLLNTIKSLTSDHELIIFVPTEPEDIKNELLKIQDKFSFHIIEYVRRIGALTHYSGGDSIFSPRFVYRSALIAIQWRYWNKQLAKINPDIVIVNSLILSWMSKLPQFQNRKSICFVRETISSQRPDLINKLFKRFLSSFSKVSFLSEFDAQSWNIPLHKKIIIRNFIDEARLDNSISREIASKTLGLKADTFHVLYVGGVSYMKGFDLAVRSVLSCKGVELIVAGNNFDECAKIHKGKLSQYEQSIKDEILNRDKKDCIHILGRQSNMSDCYAAADVLVFPMRSIHQARPVFEAGWFSKPVIITKAENIYEDLQQGVNGFMFDINQSQDLTSHIQYLRDNPSVAIKMGEENYRLTIENHRQRENCAKINELVNSLL